MLYSVAVTEISLGVFLGYAGKHIYEPIHTEEGNGNTQVVFQSLAVVLMIFGICYCAGLL